MKELCWESYLDIAWRRWPTGHATRLRKLRLEIESTLRYSAFTYSATKYIAACYIPPLSVESQTSEALSEHSLTNPISVLC